MKTIKIKDVYSIPENFPENFTGIVEYSIGIKEWLQNGKRHREGGPAVEYPSGIKSWYQNGKQHRLDGPALEYSNGDKKYYILGHQLTENQFDIFKFLWENSTHEQTNDLMEIFVKLALIMK